MIKLTPLLQHFGFTVRELADVLGISHTMVLHVEKLRRRASPKLTELLEHPLFTEVEFENPGLPPLERTQAETDWLRLNLHQAEGRLKKEKTNLERIRNTINGNRNILYHTRNIGEDNAKGKDPVLDWWNWQRSKALSFFQNRNYLTLQQQQEKKVYLLEKEVEYLTRKLSRIMH